ncbi:MAG: flagellar export protein FliJ [Hyphomicrobiales bacterium]|nr:MAG: flagellar export protein FliJ [Hyphomicrobiales bacterium]
MKSRQSLIRLKTFQVDEKRRQVSQIDQMIGDFQLMAEELDKQIVVEQEKAGIHDVSHFAYPTFAKAAAERRGNLQASIQDLQQQRGAAQEVLEEAIGELKKVELLEERDQERNRHNRDMEEQDMLDEIAMQRRNDPGMIG